MRSVSGPKVSVIMNCFNGEKYLRDSLKSVYKQTYKNWELIFWDNNSTDNTYKILSKNFDKRIKYFRSEKFLKLYEARNEAVKKAKGTYISFLDTDDIWKNNFLKKHIKCMQEFNSEIVYSKYLIKNEQNNKIYLKDEKNLISGYLTQNLLNNYNIGIIAVMIKKNIFKKYKFNSNLNLIGDFDFFFRVSLKYRFIALNNALAIYRFHKDNFTNRNSRIYYLEFKHWYKDNFKLIKKFSLIKIKYIIFKLRLKYYLKLIF